jgi:hypothetical protein
MYSTIFQLAFKSLSPPMYFALVQISAESQKPLITKSLISNEFKIFPGNFNNLKSFPFIVTFKELTLSKKL